ncbi:MAG: hypothetical protein Q7K35_05840 [bacterium]|nr:hypothetical protein [bacterium]
MNNISNGVKKFLLIGLIFYLILPKIAEGGGTLTGRILLQVEDKGQAWYVNPADEKRYSLGRPDDAYNLMRKLSIGISNEDLKKIPVGLSSSNYPDSDEDGLNDNLEDALGTDKNKTDTDADGYDDKTELTNGYNPLGSGKQPIDEKFTRSNSGKIFLQVQKNGEAWYVEPVTQKRYSLGRPGDAFQIMRTFGLGITNANLEKIPVGQLPIDLDPTDLDPIDPDPFDPDPIDTLSDDALQSAASAIRAADGPSAISFFTPNMQKSIEYSVEHMPKESLLILANILSGSTLESSAETTNTYSNEVYFQGEKHTVYFYVEKQPDETWLLTNL